METIKFEKVDYPSKIISLPFGDRKISIVDLNESLLNQNGSYISEEARLIDEEIFYFVESNQICFNENVLSKIILSEI